MTCVTVSVIFGLRKLSIVPAHRRIKEATASDLKGIALANFQAVNRFGKMTICRASKRNFPESDAQNCDRLHFKEIARRTAGA